MRRGHEKLVCHCGKLATRKVGDIGYCSIHREDAAVRIKKFGNPRTPKRKAGTSKVRLIHVDKLDPKQKKQIRQKELKANATETEQLLKKLLANNPETEGLWVFQPIVLGYFPDFLCPKAKLIVELDGYQHYTPEGMESDKKRTAVLSGKGYRVIRFSNRRVLVDPSDVMARIIATQQERMK